MIKKRLCILILLSLLVASCAPSQPAIQTAVAQTQIVWTPIPTQTPYATYTLQPTIVITKIVTETFTPVPTFTPSPTTPSSNIMVDGGYGHFIRGYPTDLAFYMLIHNTGLGSDRLIGASSELCGQIVMDHMTPVEEPTSPVNIDIPAGSVFAFELKAFSYRLICLNITSGVVVGNLIPLKLTFERYGTVMVTVEVKW